MLTSPILFLQYNAFRAKLLAADGNCIDCMFMDRRGSPDAVAKGNKLVSLVIWASDGLICLHVDTCNRRSSAVRGMLPTMSWVLWKYLSQVSMNFVHVHVLYVHTHVQVQHAIQDIHVCIVYILYMYITDTRDISPLYKHNNLRCPDQSNCRSDTSKGP